MEVQSILIDHETQTFARVCILLGYNQTPHTGYKGCARVELQQQ